MQGEMDYCQCRMQELEKNKIKDKSSELYEKIQSYRSHTFKKMMPSYLYYIMLSNNIFMLISFLASPILFYYANRIDNPFFSRCFNRVQLCFLMIFLFINTVQKFFLLEKLNNNTCCVDRLEKMLRGYGHDIIATKKLKKNFRRFISTYTFILVVIITSTIYFIFINIKNRVLKCSDDDIFGFVITRMILLSSFTGCVFNLFEFKLLNSLIVRIMNKNLNFNFISLFNCFESCTKKSKQNKHKQDDF